MLGISSLPLFVLTVFLLNVTPGPDTAYIVGRSVAQGRAAGVASALGISAGCCVHTLASTFGLTALLAASPLAFTIIKFSGAAYLIYLGVRLLSARHAAPVEPARTAPQRSLRAVFLQGFLTNVMNPKVILFFLSFLPQFVRGDSPHQALAFLTLGAIIVAMSTVWNSGVAWMAGSLTDRMGQRPALKRWLNRVVGGAFIGLGLRLALVRR